MSRIRIEVDEAQLKRMVLSYIETITGQEMTEDAAKEVTIQVKTKANWKAEWETGQFKAVYERTF